MTSRVKPNPLWITFVAALVLRIGYGLAVGELGRTPPLHYREYVSAATRLLEQGTFTSPLVTGIQTSDASALLPPAYQLIVAAVYGLLGVESLAATVLLHLLNVVAGSLAVTMTFAIARRLAGTSAAWIAFVIDCVNPTLIVFTTYIWDTCLFTLGVTVAVWMSVRLAEGRHPAIHWLGFGLFLGALALLNPALTICYPLLALWPASARGWRSLGHLLPAPAGGGGVARGVDCAILRGVLRDPRPASIPNPERTVVRDRVGGPRVPAMGG